MCQDTGGGGGGGVVVSLLQDTGGGGGVVLVCYMMDNRWDMLVEVQEFKVQKINLKLVVGLLILYM